MAQITIEELYRGDEYNVMGNALAELMTERKETNDTRTTLSSLRQGDVWLLWKCLHGKLFLQRKKQN